MTCFLPLLIASGNGSSGDILLVLEGAGALSIDASMMGSFDGSSR